jgi:carboxypeptidase family protein
VNFAGSLHKFVLGGRLVDHFGVAMSGVTMTLNGAQTATTQTNSQGQYQFKDLLAGNNYTVTPSKTNYDFSPQSQYFYDLNGNWNAVNFTGTMRTYSIVGQVFNNSANGLEGITVTLSGTRSGTSITNSDGAFFFSDVPAGGNYTVTPSKAGLGFSPANRSFTSLSNNQGGVNFIASPAATASVGN